MGSIHIIPKRLMVMSGKYPRPPVKRDARKRNYMAKPVSLHTIVVDSFPYVGDNIGAAKVLRELADKNLLILYTVRDGKYLQDAVD